MPPYVTVGEDGPASPEESRPLHRFPDTIGGLFDLLSREFAPWAQRGASLQARVEGLPELLRAGIAALSGLPGRPVGLLQLETALGQLSGVTELVDSALAEARRRADAGEAPELVQPMERAAQSAHSSHIV